MSTKNDVLNLARKIAQAESEKHGKKYTECMSEAIDLSLKKLNVDSKEFIDIFT